MRIGSTALEARCCVVRIVDSALPPPQQKINYTHFDCSPRNKVKIICQNKPGKS